MAGATKTEETQTVTRAKGKSDRALGRKQRTRRRGRRIVREGGLILLLAPAPLLPSLSSGRFTAFKNRFIIGTNR